MVRGSIEHAISIEELDCDAAHHSLASYVKDLSSKGLWPPTLTLRNLTISGILAKLDDLADSRCRPGSKRAQTLRAVHAVSPRVDIPTA
jgi:hypothetical protein